MPGAKGAPLRFEKRKHRNAALEAVYALAKSSAKSGFVPEPGHKSCCEPIETQLADCGTGQPEG
jgi:hypothetical protein